MTELDDIAREHTTDLDRVYPPMRWRAVWSDGANLPLGLVYPAAFARVLNLPTWYPEGLMLFSDEGHTHRVEDLGPAAAGQVVVAWNRGEAAARLRKALGVSRP